MTVEVVTYLVKGTNRRRAAIKVVGNDCRDFKPPVGFKESYLDAGPVFDDRVWFFGRWEALPMNLREIAKEQTEV